MLVLPHEELALRLPLIQVELPKTFLQVLDTDIQKGTTFDVKQFQWRCIMLSPYFKSLITTKITLIVIYD